MGYRAVTEVTLQSEVQILVSMVVLEWCQFLYSIHGQLKKSRDFHGPKGQPKS